MPHAVQRTVPCRVARTSPPPHVSPFARPSTAQVPRVYIGSFWDVRSSLGLNLQADDLEADRAHSLAPHRRSIPCLPLRGSRPLPAPFHLLPISPLARHR